MLAAPGLIPWASILLVVVAPMTAFPDQRNTGISAAAEDGGGYGKKCQHTVIL